MINKKKLLEAEARIRSTEGFYSAKCKSGSKDANDYLEMSYLSGVLNGFKFMGFALGKDVTNKKFKEALDQLLHSETVN